MPQEVTLYELKQLVLKSHRKIDELGVEVAELRGQMAGTKVLAAAIDELTAATDEQTLVNRSIGQHFEGVRRLGESTYDMTKTAAKRLRGLVQALVKAGVVTLEALHEETGEDEDGVARVATLRPQVD